MKRKEFVRKLKQDGCVLLRPGSRHDVYMNPKTGQKQPVARHTEIDNALAKHIRTSDSIEPQQHTRIFKSCASLTL